LNDFLNPLSSGPPWRIFSFTRIEEEKSRRLVRRGGFLAIHNGGLVLRGEFFAPAFRRQVSAALRAKNFIN
jgi:hypothetical protein